MRYAIIGHDNDSSLAQRREARPAHLARLEALRDDGRLILAGPFPAIDGEDPGEAGQIVDRAPEPVRELRALQHPARCAAQRVNRFGEVCAKGA